MHAGFRFPSAACARGASLGCAIALIVSQTVPAAAQVPGLTGTVIVTNKSPATATLVDVASGTTLATLPTGNGPHEIVISRDGRTAVVTDYGTGPQPGSSLTIIDVRARKVIRQLPLGEYRRPHGIVFLPGDSLVAVTVEASRAVLVVNIRAMTIVKAVATEKSGSHMLGVAADGVRAWTGDIGSNTVTELDLATGRALRSIDVPAQPEAINVTADGSEAWVGSNAMGRVSVVDARTGSVTTAAEGFGWPYRVLFSPDATLVLMPDYRGETLRFVERTTRRELGRMAFTGGGPQGITITPNGRHALLSLSTRGKVAVIDVATRTVVGELAVGETPDVVVYSPFVVRR
jgi:DNA-binding beta-propeller fold protein YncE